MKIVISQSNYIPWRGFIDLISQADIYIAFDSMQFTKNDWRNRNLIRNRNSTQWLSIPCGQSISRSIDEVFPVRSNWFIKHAETIRHCYSNAPYWSIYGKILLDNYKLLGAMSLSQLNIELIKLALELNNSKTSILNFSNHHQKIFFAVVTFHYPSLTASTLNERYEEAMLVLVRRKPRSD